MVLRRAPSMVYGAVVSGVKIAIDLSQEDEAFQAFFNCTDRLVKRAEVDLTF
jgi:hypothetical protein